MKFTGIQVHEEFNATCFCKKLLFCLLLKILSPYRWEQKDQHTYRFLPETKCKKFQWLKETVPIMPLCHAPDKTYLSSDDEWCCFDHDITNAEHIEREYCVTQLQRIKAFQRMTVDGTVSKDVPRNMWKTIPKAMEAIATERNRLRARRVG